MGNGARRGEQREAKLLESGLKEFIAPDPAEQQKVANLGPEIWNQWLKRVDDPVAEEAINAMLKAVGRSRT